MNYYEVLGVSEGADPKEIKRAYFKLVRIHSPEKDPERFQEIREAYENLMDEDKDKPMTFSFEIPDNQLSRQMFDQVEQLKKLHAYKQAMATAEEALMRFGESEGFLYLLASIQKLAGNSGKSIKNFERLIKLHPDKAIYRRELALVYMNRGYGKKAYQAFETAYQMGCRDADFLDLYALCCYERRDFSRSVSLLKELIDCIIKKPKDHIEDLQNAFHGLFIMGDCVSGSEFRDIMIRFQEFLTVSSLYLPDYREDIMDFLPYVIERAFDCGMETSLIRATIETAKKSLFSGKRRRDEQHWAEEWKYLEAEMEIRCANKDKRLSKLMQRSAEAYLIGDTQVPDPQVLRFMQRDVQLCMLERWPEIQEEIQIVQENYPIFYEAIQDYVKTLEKTKDIDLLRERLLKDYDRRAQNISGGYYYREYPERKVKKGTSQWDSDMEGTYVRSQPKVGRNDPCPCGSGKKYKNCCGRN